MSFNLPESPDPVVSEPRFSSLFVTRGETVAVHSVTAAETADGVIQAYWYGGSREGARDVAIYSASFYPTAAFWSLPERLVDRATAQRDLHRYVRKIGNPVVYRPV